MPLEACDRELAILTAVRDGGRAAAAPETATGSALATHAGDARAAADAADAADAAHLAACPTCALAVAAERWMQAAARELTPERLPTPGSLILRAQLRARRDAAERSLRPLEIWRWLALAGGGAVAVVVSGGSFMAGLWSPPTPALALLAAGAVALAALPIWLRARRTAV